MDAESEVTLWLSAEILRAGDETIEALVVEALRQELERGRTLEASLAGLDAPPARGGDFGAEIVGALLAPFLIECVRRFLKVYLTKLSEQLATDLAGYTAAQLKELCCKRFKSEADAPAALTASIRDVAAARGLDAETTAQLVDLVKTYASA